MRGIGPGGRSPVLLPFHPLSPDCPTENSGPPSPRQTAYEDAPHLISFPPPPPPPFSLVPLLHQRRRIAFLHHKESRLYPLFFYLPRLTDPEKAWMSLVGLLTLGPFYAILARRRHEPHVFPPLRLRRGIFSPCLSSVLVCF